MPRSSRWSSPSSARRIRTRRCRSGRRPSGITSHPPARAAPAAPAHGPRPGRHRDGVVGRARRPAPVPSTAWTVTLPTPAAARFSAARSASASRTSTASTRAASRPRTAAAVAAARADLEHPVRRPQLRRLRHEGDDQGLGDRLALADRQGAVLGRAPRQVGIDEARPRHGGHGVPHSGILDAALPQRPRVDAPRAPLRRCGADARAGRPRCAR